MSRVFVNTLLILLFSQSLAVATDLRDQYLAGYAKRPYDLHLPPGYDPRHPIPLLIALHGGGGSKESARKVTCLGGDLSAAGCLDQVADREGFAVLYPSGTGNGIFMPNIRTWNAGGGRNGYTCVSGKACKKDMDDVGFFRALLDHVAKQISYDPKRVYATGISNGAAMSYRLACELSDRIVGIAPVGGANQFGAVEKCEPAYPVAVVHMHGTADPCWPYGGGRGGCLQKGLDASAEDSVAFFAKRNGCAASPLQSTLASVTRIEYQGCGQKAAVSLYKIAGGGHRWPGGYAYPAPFGIDPGPVTQEINGSEVMWDFFKRHTPPR